MAAYLKFEGPEGASVLIEVDEVPAGQTAGEHYGDEVKVGRVTDAFRRNVASAHESLHDALTAVVRQNAQTLLNAVGQLDPQPAEAEITFGIKGNGELGQLGIAKVGAEATYTIRILWRRPA